MEGIVNLGSNESGKKPYNTPNLRVYGDIRVVTQAVTMTHLTGDGGMGNNKT
jgi:hypothetical protein